MTEDEIRAIVREELAEQLAVAVMTLRNESVRKPDPQDVEYAASADALLRQLRTNYSNSFINPNHRGCPIAKSLKVKKQRLMELCEQWANAGILNRERSGAGVPGYRFPQPWEPIGLDGEANRAQVVRNAFDRKPWTLADIVPLFVDGTPQRVQAEVLDWLLREGLAIEFEKDRYMMEKI